jgi:hypothetical protein
MQGVCANKPRVITLSKRAGCISPHCRVWLKLLLVLRQQDKNDEILLDILQEKFIVLSLVVAEAFKSITEKSLPMLLFNQRLVKPKLLLKESKELKMVTL